MRESVNDNNPFSMTRKEQQLEDKKKQRTAALVKTGQAAVGITPESTANGFSKLPEHKQAQFKQSYGEFYGVSKNESTALDYNKLYQASRENKVKEDGYANIPDHLKNDPGFKTDAKKFFQTN